MRTLVEYEWPGNVRELENSLDRACTLSSGPVLHLGDLPTQLQNFHLQNRRPRGLRRRPCWPQLFLPGRRSCPWPSWRKQAILETLRKLNGDKLLAARLLGIGKTTLYRKLKEYGIGAPDAEDHARNDMPRFNHQADQNCDPKRNPNPFNLPATVRR